MLCAHCWLVAAARAELVVNPSGGVEIIDGLVRRDDEVSGRRALGFAFPFFGGEPFTHLYASTNGEINFDGTHDYKNGPLGEGETMRICPLWRDLVLLPVVGDRVVEKVQPGVYYSVTWTAHEQTGLARHVFQVVLFNAAIRLANVDFLPGDIVFSYEQIGMELTKGDATIGMDDGAGSFVTIPGADPETALIPIASAAKLPLGSGFFLFRYDEDEGAYTLPMTDNSPPVAKDDVGFSGNGAVLLRPLANDSDLDEDPLSIQSATQGTVGAVVVNADGTLSYMPGVDFAGEDSFTYTVRDSFGATATGQVRIVPFTTVKGRYAGVIGDPEFPDGQLQVRIGQGGQFTGNLVLGEDEPLSFTGSFDSAGYFHADVIGPDETVNPVTLQLVLEGSGPKIAGAIGEDDPPMEVIAMRIPNGAPFAVNDIQYSVRGGPVTIAVLANDSDPDGDPLSISGFTQGRDGTVTLNANGTLNYTPGRGYSGSDGFTYTVSDGSGFTTTARVTVLAFTFAKGTYDGLVLATDEFGEFVLESSGFLKISAGPGGVFTGLLSHGGFRIALAGTFDAGGVFTREILRPDGARLTISLRMDASTEPARITGTVSDGTATAQITASSPRLASAKTTVAHAGRYTALLPSDESEAPPGHGYAIMVITPRGGVNATGKLGDGTPFTFGTVLRPDGTLPIYLSPYVKKGQARAGSLFGLLRFEDKPGESDFGGALTWDKPAMPNPDPEGDEFPGFTATIELAGARYTPPSDGGAALNFGETGEGTVDLNGSTYTVKLAGGPRILVLDAEKELHLALSLRPGTGLISGSFMEETENFDTGRITRTVRKLSGALLQEQNRGAGVFIGAEGSGYVLLDPPF